MQTPFSGTGTRSALTLAACLATACCAWAQSSDALLDKLVDKGILTVKEANELREESNKGFTQAYALKSGMPDWVTSFRFNGDIRARYEGFYSDASFVNAGTTNKFLTRNRFRYRLRFGAVATMLDNLEVGFKLTSSDPTGNFGGDPISGNTTWQDNGSKKFLYIDQVYGKWSPLQGPDWSLAFLVGKMESPFVFDDMVLDPDYTPEGFAIQAGYRINDRHSLKLNTGGFVVDEFSTDSNDPYLLGAQVRWDTVWTPKISSSFGVGLVTLSSAEMLTNNVVPNQNRGNSRNADGTLKYEFNPVVVDAAFTYTAASFPFYKGVFPIRISGEYMENPAAPNSADNYAWNAGIMFGKSGKKGTWDISYYYKWLGANSWWEELVDSDFGAFYAGLNSPPNSGSGIGYGAGTNTKGHVIKFSVSPADALTLSAKVFLTDLITPFPKGADSSMTRLQVDALWKF